MTAATMPGERRLSISEAAKALDRSPHTLRSWDRNESMPKSLRPKRDALGHRYWTPELIEQIKEWMAENEFHPGRGIDYHPTPQQLEQHIGKIRRASRQRAANTSVDQRLEPGLAILRGYIEEAINEMGVTPEQVVAALPSVIEQFKAQGHDVNIEDALRIVTDVIGPPTR